MAGEIISKGQRAKRVLPTALHEFFVCGECGKAEELMDDPVVLPCLHPICMGCLVRRVTCSLRSDEVECPACTRRTPIPLGGLKAFPKDKFSRVAKKTLIDPNYEHVPGAPNPYCGIHPRDEVTHFCNRCDIQVCKKCVNGNHKGHEAIDSLQTVAARMDNDLAQKLLPAVETELQQVGSVEVAAVL